jgi:hypothetical protein
VTTNKFGIFEYSTRNWPFAAVLTRDVFKVRQLHLLHRFVAEKKQRLGRSAKLTAEDNLTMRQVMQNLPDDCAFYRLYHAFMSKVILPLAGLPLSYSCHPKMRVHFSGTPSMSGFHDDTSITKRVDQMNIWIPFTDVYDTAAMWVESDYGLGDYAPIPMKYGQVLVFDGGYLRHGSLANTTEITRVSMDLRFSIRNGSTREDGLRLLNRVISRIESSGLGAKPAMELARAV